MPDSCANALRPTIALFGCTAYPVRRDTSRLVRAISRVLMPVARPSVERRVASSITISSSDALPARSPMPFTAHPTRRAPPPTPALAAARRHPRERVRHGQPEVVVAVDAERDLAQVGNELVQPREGGRV